jgi:hypothetical protein
MLERAWAEGCLSTHKSKFVAIQIKGKFCQLQDTSCKQTNGAINDVYKVSCALITMVFDIKQGCLFVHQLENVCCVKAAITVSIQSHALSM